MAVGENVKLKCNRRVGGGNPLIAGQLSCAVVMERAISWSKRPTMTMIMLVLGSDWAAMISDSLVSTSKHPSYRHRKVYSASSQVLVASMGPFVGVSLSVDLAFEGDNSGSGQLDVIEEYVRKQWLQYFSDHTDSLIENGVPFIYLLLFYSAGNVEVRELSTRCRLLSDGELVREDIGLTQRFQRDRFLVFPPVHGQVTDYASPACKVTRDYWELGQKHLQPLTAGNLDSNALVTASTSVLEGAQLVNPGFIDTTPTGWVLSEASHLLVGNASIGGSSLDRDTLRAEFYQVAHQYALTEENS